MIERLRHALEHIEDLPAAEQERIAERIAERIERYHRERARSHQADEPQPNSPASRFAGVWRDLPDDMEETLTAWRKASIPRRFPQAHLPR